MINLKKEKKKLWSKTAAKLIQKSDSLIYLEILVAFYHIINTLLISLVNNNFSLKLPLNLKWIYFCIVNCALKTDISGHHYYNGTSFVFKNKNACIVSIPREDEELEQE